MKPLSLEQLGEQYQVCQVLANMEYGDAVSNEALLIQRLLAKSWCDSEIYAQFVNPGLRRQCRPLSKAEHLLDDPNVLWIYHYSTSSPATEMLSRAKGPVALIYHNITPAEFLASVGGTHSSRAFNARRQLEEFHHIPSAVAADSQFNRSELKKLGYSGVKLIPLALDDEKIGRRENAALVKALRESGSVNFLTVGRLVPHKKIEDVIKVFYYYHNYINPVSRLFIIGDGEECPPYVEQLFHLVDDLGIPNVDFTGKVRLRDLIAYYKAADVYLCMSEHEGFCVPLLEAMRLDVPVFANDLPAIRETLGDAGVIIREKRADVVAEAIDLLIRDETNRTRLLESQRNRAAKFAPERLKTDIEELVYDCLDLFYERKADGWKPGMGMSTPAPLIANIRSNGKHGTNGAECIDDGNTAVATLEQGE
jgi:glycosyltransferase involved in cell wall biosynthesis